MPELEFKGKEFVRNHHLTVPFRPLVPDAAKSVGAVNTDGNLIIQGDNLEALKALLPLYAGKVDCIFIDPPYNTGNEGWCYNDNVNSPQLKAWFSENPVGIEDGLRHDKWCCMMWPRLKLLWELLSETGSIWITIGEEEVHRLRQLLDEIFGGNNLISLSVWQKRVSPDSDDKLITSTTDYLVAYAKNIEVFEIDRSERTATANDRYDNPDDDPRGPWTSSDLTRREYREHDFYPIRLPSGREVQPASGRSWSVPKSRYEELVSDRRIWFGADGNSMPRRKRFLTEVRNWIVPTSLLLSDDVGTTAEGKRQLNNIFQDRSDAFSTPKPPRLVEYVLQLVPNYSVVLDSFAGSGTTAHAVLNLNAKDGGNRKFILVELEDYADTLTAERVRRVIRGYPFQGTQRVMLYEKKLNWTELKKGDHLRAEAENTKTIYESQYDSVKITVDDGVLKVIGERKVAEHAPGLGGEFTYCTLGEPLDLLKMLSGENLPARDAIGDWLLYCASGKRESDPLPTVPAELKEHLLGKQGSVYYWLLYRPDLDWLQSPAAALTLSLAEAIHAVDPNATHRVFSPVKYVSNKMLRDRGVTIEHATIPFAFFRRGGA